MEKGIILSLLSLNRKTPWMREYQSCHKIPLSLSPTSPVPDLKLRVRILCGELACTYASLILHDDGIAFTVEKIATLVKAATEKIDSYWPGLLSKLFEKRSIEDLIMNVGIGGAPVAVAAPVAGGGGGGAAAAPTVEEKEEPKEESDDDMGFSLFD